MSCDISKGNPSGIDRILLTLQPNLSTQWTWDFADCGTTINNFVAYVQKPRGPNGSQKNLAPSVPLVVTGKDLNTGQEYPGSNFIVDFSQPGSVGGHAIRLDMLYTGSHPLDVEISYSAVLGG